MKKGKHITGFYLETLLLIVVFITVILVLVRIFGIGQHESRQAKVLTNAVTLAQNAAEAFAGSASEEELLRFLDENGNAVRSGDEITALYDADMRPDDAGEYLVSVTWEEDGEDPFFVRSRITVFHGKETNPVYALETALYLDGPPHVEAKEVAG